MEIAGQANWIAALMRAAGVTELRVTDEELTGQMRGHVLTYRDEMAYETVFRLVVPAEVIDAEEAPMPTLAITGGPA